MGDVWRVVVVVFGWREAKHAKEKDEFLCPFKAVFLKSWFLGKRSIFKAIFPLVEV